MAKGTGNASNRPGGFVFVWLLLGVALLITGFRQLADPSSDSWSIWMAFISSGLFLATGSGEWIRGRRNAGSFGADGAAS